MSATFYVSCPGTIIRIVETSGGTTLSLFAGVPNVEGCVDNANPIAATLTEPVGLTTDASGTLYFSDCKKIRKIDANGVSTFAGDGTTGYADATGGSLTTAEFSSLGSNVTVGNTLYTVDGPRIRAVTKTATSTLASGSGSRGNVLDPTGNNASYSGILGATTDAGGNIYVLLGNAVVKVDPTTGGSSLAFAIPAGDASRSPVAMTTANQKLYIAFDNSSVWQLGFDGTGFAPFAAASVTDLTSDGTNLYLIANNHTIEKIDASGTVTPVCGAPNGNVVMDGTGISAIFQQPEGIAYVGNGTLFVGDDNVGYGDILLREVDTAVGKVTTVAGNTGSNGGVQADGIGKSASFGAIPEPSPHMNA